MAGGYMRARVAATLSGMVTPARHACPACGRDAPPRDASSADRSFPFCSPACKLADLGRWLDGAYRIPGPPDEQDALPASEGDE
jgi:uncharacterized protein